MNWRALIAEKFDKDLTPLTLDWETYYGPSRHPENKKSCSLRTLSYTEYLTHPSFDINLLTIKRADEPTRPYTPAQALNALKQIDWDNTLLICHNTLFDGYINKFFCNLPNAAVYTDTMGMANCLLPGYRHDLGHLATLLGVELPTKASLEHALVNAQGRYFHEMTEDEQQAYIAYGINDTELTWAIFLKMLPHMPPKELRHLHWTLDNFFTPRLELDVDLCRKIQREDEEETDRLVKAAGVTKKQLGSNAQFAALLQNYGVTPPTKRSEKKEEDIYAFSKTDSPFLDLFQNEEVLPLLKAKQAVSSTLISSRTQRLIDTAKACSGKLPVGYKYHSAHTGRVGGTNKNNFANFPRKGGLRHTVRAPKGYKLIPVDSAQIEARGVGWLAGQDDLVTAFRLNKDVYSEFATDIYNRPIDRKRKLMDETGNYLDKDGNIVNKDNAHVPDEVEGFVGKTCILGLGYGMGAPKFRAQLALGLGGMTVIISEEESGRIVRIYRTKNHKIVALWKQFDSLLFQMTTHDPNKAPSIELGPLRIGHQCIQLPSGRQVQYPGLAFDEDTFEWSYGIKEKKKIYGAKVTENVTQALTRDIIIDQKLQIIDHGIDVVMHTYDENVALVPEDQAQDALKLMIEIMKTPPDWAKDLPLNAEGTINDYYAK